MDKFVTKRNDLLAEQVIKNLKSRQMEGHYVQTKEEALALALELIPEGSSISWGGSMSIKAIGLPEALHKGNYKVLDRDLCATPEEKAEDTFCSCCLTSIDVGHDTDITSFC